MSTIKSTYLDICEEIVLICSTELSKSEPAKPPQNMKWAWSVLNLAQARLWTCGRGDMSTPSFGSHLNPISSKGVRLCLPYTGVHTKF